MEYSISAYGQIQGLMMDRRMEKGTDALMDNRCPDRWKERWMGKLMDGRSIRTVDGWTITW